MEERVKRLERINRVLLVGLFLVIVIAGGSKLREISSGSAWLLGKGVVTESLRTNRIEVMEQTATQPKTPRVMLFPMDSETTLSFIDSTRHEMLGIGIRRDQHLGEIPYISFHTKAGVQILEPNEDGKVTWATKPLGIQGK